MKRIHEDRRDGYSFSYSDVYNLCDSDDEYEELKKKYSEKTDTSYRRYEIDTKISCSPRTIVMDGFASRGGKEISAVGITITAEHCSPCGTSYTDRTHYIKPSTLKMKTAKTEDWWV